MESESRALLWLGVSAELRLNKGNSEGGLAVILEHRGADCTGPLTSVKLPTKIAWVMVHTQNPALGWSYMYVPG